MLNTNQRGISFLLLIAFGGVIVFLLLSYFASYSHSLLLTKIFPKPPTFAATYDYSQITSAEVNSLSGQLAYTQKDILNIITTSLQTPIKIYWFFMENILK